MKSTGSLREHQREETRRAIRRAALDLCTEQGYSTVTVEAISAAAGVSPRTFFNYFPSKQLSLVPDPPVRLQGSSGEWFSEQTSVEPRDVLVELIGSLVSELEAAPPDRVEAERAFVIAQDVPEVLAALVGQLEEVQRDLARAVASRLPAPTDPSMPRLIASVAMAAVRSGLESWAAAPASEPDNPVEDVRRAAQILGSLLAGPD